MFSGKTSALLQQYKRYCIRGKRCVLIRYADDNRYTRTGIATHDLVVQSQDVISCGSKLSDIVSRCHDADVVLIDEGQFYTDIVVITEKLANSGKIVIIAGLDGDRDRGRFGSLMDLIPKAEKVRKLHAVCTDCGEKASFTKLKTKTTPSSQIDIGGSDKYTAVCRKCWFAS